MIPTIYTVFVCSLVMVSVGFVIALREMISLWREYYAETVRVVEPVRLKNRHLIIYEAVLTAAFIIFSVVVADSRFTIVTVTCVLSLCGAIALQALIKFIYHLEPVQ